MRKVVINRCFGGFGLSKAAFEAYAEAKGLNPGVWNEQWKYYEGGDFYDHGIERDDPDLVRIVETMGDKANSGYADLHIVEIPDDVQWEIEEYDGNEWVAEVHRTWS